MHTITAVVSTRSGVITARLTETAATRRQALLALQHALSLYRVAFRSGVLARRLAANHEVWSFVPEKE